MADGRRHSVDIPISRTLGTLMRVRSLRDPSTSAMSKFSALLENVNCEGRSGNGSHILRSETLDLIGKPGDFIDDFKLNSYFGKSELVSCENENSRRERTGGITLKTNELYEFCMPNLEEDNQNELLGERYCRSSCEEPSSLLHEKNVLKDVRPVNEYLVTSSDSDVERKSPIASTWNCQNVDQVKSSVSMGDNIGCFSSPCPSTPLLVNEEIDVLDCNDHGCGIGCRRSKAFDSNETNFSSYSEEHPLLCPDVHEDASCCGWMEDLKPASKEITSYSETPGNLNQKIRPKTFDDLVGQNVVARTLLGAILKGRIVSFYLFHGPRGTGKTSAARIFAAALNCLSRRKNRPCGFCQECALFFSGLSKHVKEVNANCINSIVNINSLINTGINHSLSSKFRVFIIDECHMLHANTWATLFSSREYLPGHVVFIMITPHLSKLPQIAISCSQRYYFRKIRDADIASRLEKICLDDNLDFDRVALDFIAGKSNGSIRDAHMMLEQLRLLGKKITLPMARELIGIVSDDELLDLLDLALSSDSTNTVIRARDLMRSKIDPIQLTTQLANIIMDILAGKCDESNYAARTKFCRSHTNLQKLSHALKILLESEKRLRISKNKKTWLIVSLLQLNSNESSLDANKLNLHLKNPNGDNVFHGTSSGENFNHLTTCSLDDNKLCNSGLLVDSKDKLESMWKKVIDLCQSNSLKSFLKKQGKLTSFSANPGLAVAEIEFYKPDDASRAERSWQLIASSLQSLLGCNVEIRIKLAPCATVKFSKMRKLSFSLLSFSRRMKPKQQSAEHISDFVSYHTSEKLIVPKTPNLNCPIHCGSQDDCCSKVDMVMNLRNEEGNILSRRSTSCRSFQGDVLNTPDYEINNVNDEKTDYRCCVSSNQEPESQPNCFPRSQKLQRLYPSELCPAICCIEHLRKKLLTIPRKRSFQPCISESNSHVVCNP